MSDTAAKTAAVPAVSLIGVSLLISCGGGLGAGSQVCAGATCASYQLAVELIPPPGSASLATEEVAGVTPTNGSLNLNFVEPVLFGGRVLINPTDTTGIGAYISLTRPSGIVGAPNVSYSTIAMPGSGFSIELPSPPQAPAGVAPYTYTITVLPQDPILAANIPPITFYDRMVPDTPGGTSHVTDLVLGPSSEFVNVTGRVVDNYGTPIANAEVTIMTYSGAGPTLTPQTPVSTKSSTGCDGSFVVVFRRADAGADFVVRVASGTPKTGELDTLFERHIDLLGTASSISLGDLVAWHPSSIATYTLKAQGPGLSGATVDATGAQVTVGAVDASPEPGDTWAAWRYTASAQTDSSGSVLLQLIPDTTYTYDVVTPSDSQLASVASHSLSIGAPTSTAVVLTLAQRSYIAGEVVDSSGAPADGLVVSALRPLVIIGGMSASDALAGLASVPEAVTKNGGRFSIPVDPEFYYPEAAAPVSASYNLDLQPPTGSPLPAWAFDNQSLMPSEVSAQACRPMGAVALECLLALPAAQRVPGSVVDPFGKPIAGVMVQVYAIAQPLQGCAADVDPSSCTPPPEMVATATSDSSGKFLVVLASASTP